MLLFFHFKKLLTEQAMLKDWEGRLLKGVHNRMPLFISLKTALCSLVLLYEMLKFMSCQTNATMLPKSSLQFR